MTLSDMTILLTAIGSFSADCVVASLKRAGCRVVGCDIYPSEWHAVSMDCDKVYQVPLALTPEYIPALLDICRNERITHLFPLTDLEIDVLRQHRDVFERQSIKLCIQSEKCLDIARDKYKQSLVFLDDSIVKTPRTVLADGDISMLNLPLVAKPLNGRSSEGLMFLENESDVNRIREKKCYLIQETIPGSVFTVDYARDDYGNDFAVPREELLRTKNGAGLTVRINPDISLQQMVSYIGAKLGVIGCVNMEFIYDGKYYYLIDINPRFSAGVAFSHLAGYDMVLSHLNAFNGKPILPSVNFEACIMSKRYSEVKICLK